MDDRDGGAYVCARERGRKREWERESVWETRNYILSVGLDDDDNYDDDGDINRKLSKPYTI